MGVQHGRLDDDFQEDVFDEFEPEADELDMETESEEPVIIEPDDPEAAFDFQDAFILGGMIVGQAYEEALDEKVQQKQQDKEDKEGEDLIYRYRDHK
jgi:hypothetical protein